MNKPRGKIYKINKIITMILIFIVVSSTVLFVSAETPYKTYIYTGGGQNVEISPDAYTLRKVYIESDLGIDKFNGPNDLFVDKDENIYVVDTGNSRVVIFNSDYTLKLSISTFKSNGTDDALNKPQGIFVTAEGDIYIADTGNGRLVVFDKSGTYKRTLGAPEILILDTSGQKFIYQPVSLVVDDSGRIYVVALAVNMGIIQLSSEGLYEGFIGAQKVSYNPLEYVWKQLMTSDQNERMKSFVPTEYNNVTIDKKGFIYATTSAISSGDLQADIRNPSKTPRVSAIKRLNPSGEDVLHRNGGISICGDLKFEYVEGGKNGQSVITDVALGDSKTYTLLDTNRNRYFTYSYEGDMLFAYGVYGNQSGTTLSPSAIAYKGTDFLVLDSKTGKITVYKRTKYGELIYKALDHFNNFRYDEAVTEWKNVLKINSNLDLAYLGIGQSLAKDKNLKEAMSYFKIADSRTYYSDAYKEYRQEIFEKYFPFVLAIIFLLLFAFTKFKKTVKKINNDPKYKPKRKKLLGQISYAYYLMFHPFDGFWDLKHENRGSTKAGTIIMIMATLTCIFNQFFGGYLFTPKIAADSVNFTLISNISGIIVPVLLWTLANWCLTTLMDGEGSLKDIYTSTTYSLMPIVLFILPLTLVSHFMVQGEWVYITFLTSVAYIWTIGLVITGSMVAHQYTFTKNLVTSALSVVGIGIIMFLILIVLTIVQRMWGFVEMIYKEIIFRI